MEIKRMIQQNESSLLKMYVKTQRKADNNVQFKYLGVPHVKVFDESVKQVYVDDGMIYAKNERAFDKWYKSECERVFSERIEYCLRTFSDIPRFALRIRSMTSRWGVNNVTKKIITLNSELLKRDVTLIDYVIVHELCHMKYKNHNKDFYDLVATYISNYKEIDKWLKNNGKIIMF
jgi:predicted metal-dependent hydrolase